jgi:4-hydroxybenzoyl-CoA thioesterase
LCVAPILHHYPYTGLTTAWESERNHAPGDRPAGLRRGQPKARVGLTSPPKAGFSAPARLQPEPGMTNLVYHRQFTVEWGHCDPAGIVFNSRFFEFFDWNAWLLFEAALGVRPSELGATFGIVGIPLVDAQARFLKPAKFNDVADIASEVSEFRRSSFEMKHRISIGGDVAVEGSETRVWAAQDPMNPVKLKGIPIPAAVIERFRA